MKKIFLISLLLVCICWFSLIICADAEENDYNYKGFSFEYDNTASSVYPVLAISCDYPEEIPHKNYPHSWNPSYYTIREQLILDIPDSDLYITGSFVPFYSFRFPFDEIEPVEGEYKIELIQDGSKILFEQTFNLSKDFSVEVKSAIWKFKLSNSAWTYKDSVDKDDIQSIIGINLVLNISNIGDIPFSVGGNYLQKLPISYKFDIYKADENIAFFSKNLTNLIRTNDLIEGNNNENNFFKPDEKIEYSEDVTTKIDGSYVSFDVGDYIIKGELHIDNMIYSFSSDTVLSVVNVPEKSDSSPGFEIIFLVCAVCMVLFYFKKKTK